MGRSRAGAALRCRLYSPSLEQIITRAASLRKKGRDYLKSSAYHAVLAVKDEGGDASPPWPAVFDP
jgi:hypothetical protein